MLSELFAALAHQLFSTWASYLTGSLSTIFQNQSRKPVFCVCCR